MTETAVPSVDFETFGSAVGSGMDFCGEPGTDTLARMTMREITGGPKRPFSLVFEGDVNQPLTQGTYFVSGGGLTDLPIFVVRIGPATYQAVFN